MKNISAYVYLSVISILCGGCHPDQETYRKVETHNSLSRLIVLTFAAIESSGESPPKDTSDYVVWLETNASDYIKEFNELNADVIFIDIINKTVTDVWGNQIQVVYQNNVHTGLGSCGPDGRWSDGKGDDIFFDIQNIK